MHADFSDRPPLSAAAQQIADKRLHDSVREVRDAITAEPVVVVGMGWNPHVRKVRAALDEAGIAYHYLGYGNYLTGWKQRLQIKIWSGWATFPQVFVNGTLVGGNSDVRSALADGTLQALLNPPASAQDVAKSA